MCYTCLVAYAVSTDGSPPAHSSSKAAFTSLSHRVGQMVVEMHMALADCLGSPAAPAQAQVLLAQLSLAERLAAVSPYGRLQRPLAWTLTKSSLPFLRTSGTLFFAMFEQ